MNTNKDIQKEIKKLLEERVPEEAENNFFYSILCNHFCYYCFLCGGGNIPAKERYSNL